MGRCLLWLCLEQAWCTHILCYHPFPEEKPKAKQDFNDVLKVRLWFSDQLREQTCWAGHYSCFFWVNMDGFIQCIFISGFIFHDISSIPWLTVFIIVKFDYRTRQNYRARYVYIMPFLSCHFSLRIAWGDDQFWVCWVTWSQKLFWSYLDPTKNISYTWNACWFFFSSWFPAVPHGETTWEWGDTVSGSQIIWAVLSFAFCLFLSLCQYRFPDQSRVCRIQRFSQCQNVACWPGATLQFFTFMWHYESK